MAKSIRDRIIRRVLYPSNTRSSARNVLQEQLFRHILASTVSRLDRAAHKHELVASTGDFILLRDPAASVRPQAEAVLKAKLHAHPEAVLAYGDTLYGSVSRQPEGHWFKPCRTDRLLVAQGLLLGPIVALRRDVEGAEELVSAAEIGGGVFQRTLAEFALGHRIEALVHVPYPIALTDRPAEPTSVGWTVHKSATPLVSLIIPTRNGWPVLESCLASLATTKWPKESIEILVIDNGSDAPDLLHALATREAAGALRVVRAPGEFNFSKLINRGAQEAKGSLLMLLNNDTTVRNPDWLSVFASAACTPGVGAVGCKLLYPDGSVQHSGAVFGIRNGAQHCFTGLAEGDAGYNSLALCDRTVSAVTAACMMVSREAFDAVGGLREDLAVSYNDMVFCADLMAAGYRNICLAEAHFFHHESKSRGRDQRPDQKTRHRAERDRARALHPTLFQQDPYYSPILSSKVMYELLEYRPATDDIVL